MKRDYLFTVSLTAMLGLSLLFSGLMAGNSLKAQQVMQLYQDSIPGSKAAEGYNEVSITGTDQVTRISKVSRPTLTVYKPTGVKNTHTAMIICPGGGYSILAFNKEGSTIAQRLASWGITAFVLKYRLPSEQIMEDKAIGPLMDAQRAIALIRSQAAQWDIAPDKIGIMGFSAGGHLAASLSTLYDRDLLGSSRPAGVSLRPDFTVLGYPVISMEKEITHMGSRKALLGEAPSDQQVELFSLQQQVTGNTPPAFIVLAGDDRGVAPANSLAYVQALQQNKIPVELHMYQKGGHGFGGYNPQSSDDWLQRLRHWMQDNHLID